MPARLSFVWLACTFWCLFARAAPPSQLTGVTLECEIELKAHLEVSYSVQNRSTVQIGIFSRVQDVPGPCYVDFQDGKLLLEKLALPVPPGLEVAVRIAPNVRLLRSGETFHEQFSLPVPVAVNNLYRRALLVGRMRRPNITADKPRQAYTVTLSIGLFQVDPGFRFDPIGKAEPGVYRVWPPGLAVNRQVILSNTVRLREAVDVLDF